MIGNVAVVWPARMVTVAGTVASVVSLEARLTIRLLAGALEAVTVPVTGASPSRAEAGMFNCRLKDE